MFAAHLAERLVAGTRAGGIVPTTINRGLQERLEALARDRSATLGAGVSAAILVIDNGTGEVRAHVGGTGYFDRARAGQVDLAFAIRSPGSTLKPFIYGLGFEDGLVHPETLIDDRAIRYGAYAPENFDDTFHGTVTVRTALQQSLNVPALQLLETLVHRVAQAILDFDPEITSVTVVVAKLRPPVPEDVATVGVRCSVQR